MRDSDHNRTKVRNDDFHRRMWERSKRGKVSFGISELGRELGVDRLTARIILREAVELGQMLELTPANSKNPGTYMVADPNLWKQDDPATHAQRRRTIVWG